MADRDEEVAREIALRHNDVGVTRALIDDIATALRQAREEGRKEQPITAETVRRVLSAHDTEKHADPGYFSENTTMTYREFCEAIAQRANQGVTGA